jgi:hypothetical protein
MVAVHLAFQQNWRILMKANRLLHLLSALRGNAEAAKVAIKSFLSSVHGLMPMEFEGNFMATQGVEPRTIFVAHYDTVDPRDKTGVKTLVFRDNERTILGLSSHDTSGATCLGADDGAGCEILACLYEAGVPGIYIWSAEEESGCLGTKRLLKSFPDVIRGVDRVVSFDRKGTSEIITHQMGYRTCSDEFATALCQNLMGFHKSNEGCFTDSREYAWDVPECTNISVGYQGAHTKGETLNLKFLQALIEALITINWELLPLVRDPLNDDDELFVSEDLCYHEPALVHRFLLDMGLTEELEEYARWAYGQEKPKGKSKGIKLWDPDDDPNDPFYSSYVYP